MIGQHLSHYRILEEIDRGGMGIVYRAEDLRLNREVALKVLPPELVKDAEQRKRFVQEARATASLEHPHIGVVHEIDEDSDTIFIAMEYIRGEALSASIDESRFSLSRKLELSAQIAAGLAHAHDRGIVHRDLKPSNVKLTELGYPKLIDFGLAKLLDAEKSPFLGQTGQDKPPNRSETREGVLLGTAAYMSPEQARGGRVDHRSDIFSFGLLVYHLVGGAPPFHGPTRLDTLHAILRDPTPPLPELSAPSAVQGQLETILGRCLEKDPSKRYQSAAEVESDLRRVRLLLESAIAAEATQKPKPRRVRPWVYVLAGIATLGIAMAVYDGLSPGPSNPSGEKPFLAVMHFNNLSGDQELDWLRAGLADMLVTDLSQSPNIELLGSDRLQQVLEDMGRTDAQPTAEAIERIAESTNINTVVLGSFAKLGDTVRLSARLQDAETGVVLASEKVEGDGEQSVFRLVDDLSRRIRTHLTPSAESNPVVDVADSTELDRDLKEVTTASLEAYRHYAEGIRLHELYREEESIPHFERAVAIDPGFAMALAKLGVVHSNLGREAEARRYAERALDHLERASARERYYIQGWAYSLSPDTLPEAIDAYERAVDLYPDHASARHNLANLLLKLENYDDAIEHLERLRRMGAQYSQSWEQLAESYIILGEFDRAERVLQEFIGRRPESHETRLSLARLRTLRGNYQAAAGLLEEAEQLGAKPGDVDSIRFLANLLAEDWEQATELARRHLRNDERRDQFLWGRNLSLVALYQGRSEPVLDGMERFLSSLGDDLTHASGPMTFLAMLHIDRGDYAEAREVSERLKRLGAYGEINGTFIEILADEHLGDSERAERTLADYSTSLEQVFGQGAQRIHYLLDGKLKIHRGDYDEAVASLTEAESLLPPRGPDALHSTIWFALAEAHRREGNESEAIRWYRRITEAKLERLYDPVSYVRSFYFLGRLYEEEDEESRALASYSRFVQYWSDGDLDRDRVRLARERVAELEAE